MDLRPTWMLLFALGRVPACFSVATGHASELSADGVPARGRRLAGYIGSATAFDPFAPWKSASTRGQTLLQVDAAIATASRHGPARLLRREPRQAEIMSEPQDVKEIRKVSVVQQRMLPSEEEDEEKEAPATWLELKGMTATQVSTAKFQGGFAAAAVDLQQKSCTLTQVVDGAWWQVNLGGEFQVKTVAVIGSNTSQNDSNPLQIMVDGHACALQKSPRATFATEISCGRNGSVVRLIGQKKAALSLCEVKVQAMKYVVSTTHSRATTTATTRTITKTTVTQTTTVSTTGTTTTSTGTITTTMTSTTTTRSVTSTTRTTTMTATSITTTTETSTLTSTSQTTTGSNTNTASTATTTTMTGTETFTTTETTTTTTETISSTETGTTSTSTYTLTTTSTVTKTTTFTTETTTDTTTYTTITSTLTATNTTTTTKTTTSSTETTMTTRTGTATTSTTTISATTRTDTTSATSTSTPTYTTTTTSTATNTTITMTLTTRTDTFTTLTDTTLTATTRTVTSTNTSTSTTTTTTATFSSTTTTTTDTTTSTTATFTTTTTTETETDTTLTTTTTTTETTTTTVTKVTKTSTATTRTTTQTETAVAVVSAPPLTTPSTTRSTSTITDTSTSVTGTATTRTETATLTTTTSTTATTTSSSTTATVTEPPTSTTPQPTTLTTTTITTITTSRTTITTSSTSITVTNTLIKPILPSPPELKGSAGTSFHNALPSGDAAVPPDVVEGEVAVEVDDARRFSRDASVTLAIREALANIANVSVNRVNVSILCISGCSAADAAVSFLETSFRAQGDSTASGSADAWRTSVAGEGRLLLDVNDNSTRRGSEASIAAKARPAADSEASALADPSHGMAVVSYVISVPGGNTSNITKFLDTVPTAKIEREVDRFLTLQEGHNMYKVKVMNSVKRSQNFCNRRHPHEAAFWLMLFQALLLLRRSVG
eukprot:TRINITY_DN54597_c0_g1_i1.p1 TRINITY_DN54597_c0_g1~~TRINITY_DN54597_c0_g1_i1.p1  ORF type:complete len:949 (-),score=129.16 TRINITY_DN54597_c0_g1_i1:309-3155(-)